MPGVPIRRHRAPAVPDTDTDSDGGQPQFYVVDVNDTTGVNLKDLGINGSAATAYLDGDGHACAQDSVGAYYHDASGSMTNDTVTDIEHADRPLRLPGRSRCVRDHRLGSAVGSALTMNSDNVNNYDKNGITCDDPGTVCTINNTTVTGNRLHAGHRPERDPDLGRRRHSAFGRRSRETPMTVQYCAATGDAHRQPGHLGR